MASRRPQEGPKRGNANRQFEPSAPRGPQVAPRSPQEAPKRPNRCPKRPQNGPLQRPQNSLQEAPERSPTRSQPTFKRPLTHNPGAVAGWAGGHEDNQVANDGAEMVPAEECSLQRDRAE